MKFTSLLFWVQENKLSEKFYKKLGFEVVQSDDETSTVQLGELELVLVNMRDEVMFAKDAIAGEKGLGMYIYINVNDVDEFHTNLQKQGIKPHTEPKDWPWAKREFVVKDPDGYKLIFWQKSK